MISNMPVACENILNTELPADDYREQAKPVSIEVNAAKSFMMNGGHTAKLGRTDTAKSGPRRTKWHRPED